MTVRFYIMPLTVTASNARGPKYLKWRDNPTGLDVPWSMIDFGKDPTCLLWADVQPADHTSLIANADVMAAPSDIDTTIINASQRDNVKAKLDSLTIPSSWVVIGMSYRNVLRPVARMFLLSQRYFATTGRTMIEAGYSWQTLISDMPQDVVQGLKAAAQSCGYDIGGVQVSMTFGEGMKFLGDQWTKPILMNGVSL